MAKRKAHPSSAFEPELEVRSVEGGHSNFKRLERSHGFNTPFYQCLQLLLVTNVTWPLTSIGNRMWWVGSDTFAYHF